LQGNALRYGKKKNPLGESKGILRYKYSHNANRRFAIHDGFYRQFTHKCAIHERIKRSIHFCILQRLQKYNLYAIIKTTKNTKRWGQV